MKTITVTLNDSLHYKLKNRCKYHAFTYNDIINKCMLSFVAGKYDEEFDIVEAAKGEFRDD